MKMVSEPLECFTDVEGYSVEMLRRRCQQVMVTVWVYGTIFEDLEVIVSTVTHGYREAGHTSQATMRVGSTSQSSSSALACSWVGRGERGTLCRAAVSM